LASNKIIQSDNAVIDYTVISAIIDAINSQQDIIDNLKTQQDTTVNNYDELGKLVSSRVGPLKTIGNKVPVTKNPVVITFPSGSFTKVLAVVGTVVSTKKTDAYAYLQKFDNNSATFTIVGTLAGCSLSWIATGTTA
jgi:hypothetical protein